MTEDVYIFILGIAGTIIMLSFGIIGFFISRIISDVKNNTEKIGRNKGNIELLAQRQQSDISKFEQMTELKFQRVSDDLSALTQSVNRLAEILSDKK